jgi:flagellar biosynthesis protein FlhG
MVNNLQSGINFRLIINRVTEPKEGKQTADKITLVAKKFLQVDIPTMGFVSDDNYISKAVKRQIPFTVAYPHSPASRNLQEIADQYVQGRPSENAGAASGVKGFLSKMMRLMK